jgi:hypothetical protein
LLGGAVVVFAVVVGALAPGVGGGTGVNVLPVWPAPVVVVPGFDIVGVREDKNSDV